MSNYSKQIDKLLRDYLHYMSAHVSAGNSNISHTTVSTAIKDANNTHERMVAAITALLAQAEVAVYDRIINHFEGLEGYMPVRHSPKESVLIELQQLKANQKEQKA